MSLFSINNSRKEKIKNITAENLTQEQIEKYFYIEKNGEIIFHIPDELNTEEIRNKVFNLNVRNIMYLNELDITENMLIEAVKKSDEIIVLPILCLTQKICNEAFKKNKKYVTQFESKFITREMSEYIVENFPSEFFLIPEKHMTIEMCRKSLEKDYDSNINLIMEKFLNLVKI